MKTYVLIARHLGMISGEKIYHHNKLAYLVGKGWRVLFVSCRNESTPVDGADNYSHFVFPALTYAPECYSRREVNKTVDGIVRAIGDFGNGQCIIESDSLNRAAWAELVSKRINAKHLAIFLQEKHNYDEEAKKFLKFKYNRHELAGITFQSINLILGDDSITRRDDTRVKAFCNNCVQKCEETISSQLPKDVKYTFGSIGRLDKGCVIPILEGFKEFAASHPDEKYNLVLIGGATGRKRICLIRELMEDCENVNLIITGYMYPIPESLINNIDLFVSTAGSTSASYRFHKPTIKVHPVTGEPVGILGLDDLKDKSMYDVMSNMKVSDCIERALAESYKINYIYNKFDDYYEAMYSEFDRQLGFAETVKEKEYYDDELLMKIRTSHIKGHKWHRIIGHLLGARGLNYIIGLYKVISGM